MTRLIELEDADFDWLGDEHAPARAGLRRPPGGVDHPSVLAVIRRMNQRLVASGCRRAWMIVDDNEVVGLCSFKAPPSAGAAEIGYGIASSRRTRGHATSAVAAIVDLARADPSVQTLVAETALSNPASERVLEKNGFSRNGRRRDSDDGLMSLWTLVL